LDPTFHLSGEPVPRTVFTEPPALPALGEFPPVDGPGRVFEFDGESISVAFLGEDYHREAVGSRYVLYDDGTLALQHRAGALLHYGGYPTGIVGSPGPSDRKGTYLQSGDLVVMRGVLPGDSDYPWGTARLIGDQLEVVISGNWVDDGLSGSGVYLRAP
jgi:hypothetical protein